MIENEAEKIIEQFERVPSSERLGLTKNHLEWYLCLSRQWAVHHLLEISKFSPGSLLDVGAFYGLISGVSEELGWKVHSIDDCQIPRFSSTKIAGRGIEVSETTYNACTDTLPYPDGAFDLIVLSEVLEHLPYSPLMMFREFNRILKPGGRLQISTPNPAGLGKLISLALGLNPLEPNVSHFIKENDTFTHKGLTFFKSGREIKLWTVKEIDCCLVRSGLAVDKYFHYGTTVVMPDFSLSRRITTIIKRFLLPVFGRLPINGGSLFVVAKKPG